MVENVEFITGFSEEGYQEYGWRLLDSFKQFGKRSELIVYSHDIAEQLRPWVRQREQNDIPGLMGFLQFSWLEKRTQQPPQKE